MLPLIALILVLSMYGPRPGIAAPASPAEHSVGGIIAPDALPVYEAGTAGAVDSTSKLVLAGGAIEFGTGKIPDDATSPYDPDSVFAAFAPGVNCRKGDSIVVGDAFTLSVNLDILALSQGLDWIPRLSYIWWSLGSARLCVYNFYLFEDWGYSRVRQAVMLRRFLTTCCQGLRECSRSPSGDDDDWTTNGSNAHLRLIRNSGKPDGCPG